MKLGGRCARTAPRSSFVGLSRRDSLQLKSTRVRIANRHALRPRIVPDDHAHDDEPKQLALFLPRNDHELAAITQPLRDEQLRDRPPARLSWMKLLARVFQIATNCTLHRPWC
jgi:hypothetical protein